MNTRMSQSDQYQQPAWSVPYHSQARNHPHMGPKSRTAYAPWRKRLMNARVVALLLPMAALLSSSLLSSTAAAVEPEKQPIYSNINSNGLCGSAGNHCQVPSGQRLIIDHVSGFFLAPASADATIAVQLLITDPRLGLTGNAFHTFVATKTDTTGSVDTFAFSTPFRMMLHPGATFFFSPEGAVAVSGYLAKQ